jgi:hypothetical protein
MPARFVSLPFTPAKKQASEGLVKQAQLLESYILCLPAGREQSLALTKLEECVMWANRAIAVADSPTWAVDFYNKAVATLESEFHRREAEAQSATQV